MDTPYVEITRQPVDNMPFCCENEEPVAVLGCDSTSVHPTYLTIRIPNYSGDVLIIISCVSIEQPYRPHPNKVIGREGCTNGVCKISTCITPDSNECLIKNLCIQRVRTCDIADALLERRTVRLDPFRTGFHIASPQYIDLLAVRLCFQVFIADETKRHRRALEPVVSNIIYDQQMTIVESSHCSGSAGGGSRVILLCRQLTAEDLVVVFYLKQNNLIVWEASAEIIAVHEQAAIVFKTPPFRNKSTREHVHVKFQLRRLGNNARSNSCSFEYIPDYPDVKKGKQLTPILYFYH